MTEHDVCVGCKWNNYPTCDGTIIDGSKMNIENLVETFLCGVKDLDEAKITSNLTRGNIKRIELMNRANEVLVDLLDIKTRLDDLEKI